MITIIGLKPTKSLAFQTPAEAGGYSSQIDKKLLYRLTNNPAALARGVKYLRLKKDFNPIRI